MPSHSYLEEYRRKYGSVSLIHKQAPAGKSISNTDLQTLLDRYLGPSTPRGSVSGNDHSISSVRDDTGILDNSDERDGKGGSSGENMAIESDLDDIFDEGSENVLMLPTTALSPRSVITVEDVVRKEADLGDIRHRVEIRRHSSPQQHGDGSASLKQRRRGRAISLQDNGTDSKTSSLRHSYSDRNMRGIRRNDSTLSNQSVESNASNRSNFSLQGDLLEIVSDEDFDFDYDGDLNSSKQSDSDSQKLMSTFKLDTDSQKDAESLTGFDEAESCPNCQPLSARSASSSSNSDISLCARCVGKRTERHATIQEILDSELSYLRDLELIKEHYQEALLTNGLLKHEEVDGICGNIERLIAISKKFSKQMSEQLDKLKSSGDDFYTDASIGRMICDSSAMFLAFEAYCLNYNSSVTMIDQLRKENELFNLFLEASQNDNPALRRMDLKTFLMIPVQRIMKYPLLLKRLHKVTHLSHPDRDSIERANEKLTNILHHINTQCKLISSIMLPNAKDGGGAKKKTSFEIALTKLVLDTLDWKHDEIHFLNSGKIGYLLPSENQTIDKIKTARFTTAYAVIVSQGQGQAAKHAGSLMFKKQSAVKNVSLVIMKKGTSRLQVIGEPISLSTCIVSRNAEFYDVYEIQDTIKDTFVIRPCQSSESWFKNLKYFSMVLGGRNQGRRNALPNILLPV